MSLLHQNLEKLHSYFAKHSGLNVSFRSFMGASFTEEVEFTLFTDPPRTVTAVPAKIFDKAAELVKAYKDELKAKADAEFAKTLEGREQAFNESLAKLLEENKDLKISQVLLAQIEIYKKFCL